jgi:inner membrane protein
MDTITQALLGATIAEAGFRDRLGGKAVLFGAVCGVLPDLDVMAGLAGEWASLVHHRGVTHSLVVLPIAAFPIGWLGARLLGSREQPWSWIHLAFWALITHPLLDLFTAYGTQLFAPLSDARHALDGVSIIDPIYSAPLAFAVLKRKRRIAAWVLAVTTCYLFFGYALGLSAERAARRELAAFQPVAVRAVVPIAFPLLRRVIARDEGGDLRIGTWSPFKERIDFLELERSDDPLIDRALATEEGEIFRWFADGYLHAIVEPREGGADVVLSDQRYGMYVEPEKGPFRARVRFGPNGDVLGVERISQASFDLRRELAAGWEAMW